MPDLLADIEALLEGLNRDPHGVLGVHPRAAGVVVRMRHPTAVHVALVADGGIHAMCRVDDRGLFELDLPVAPAHGHRFELHYVDGSRQSVGDPYRFLPTLGELDLHLIGEGRHERLWEALGGHPLTHQGVAGVRFAVWAPNAQAVRVVGDWNGWDGRVHPLRCLGSSGVWELFVPLVEVGARYKFEVIGQDGRLVLKADPLARATEVPPATASVVEEPTHRWRDDVWMAARPGLAFDRQLSFYEVHLPSWRSIPEEDDRCLTYVELADALADHVEALGFTHVELLPVAEHPFGGSWGYQVSGYYAPTSRHGSPDDFRAFVDTMHRRGIGVVVDWVPAHFPRDDFSLARFDGSALYEHVDPRQGEHPDWGTLIFNYGRNEVRNFLVANALYWLESFHLDGLRVDAVASMLYLDYSRPAGEWLPNSHGGRENLEAVAFLQELNSLVHARHPGVLTIAEESTAWGGVSQPVDVGGLGFTHKWNMGWMHDTLGYFALDPVYRSHHHDELTFGLIYAWQENFILPLSHDEIVHGKGSLLQRMPGDDWQRFANLRALFGWMWAHPGKQLLFMGGEFGQRNEWDHERSLDWHLLDAEAHRGITRLVGDLNRTQAAFAALHDSDFNPRGFGWLDASDVGASVFAFQRSSQQAVGTGKTAPSGIPVATGPVVCAANLTPVPRYGYRLGLPRGGSWREVLNTDAVIYGGSGVLNGQVVVEEVPWQGCNWSAVITLAPLAVLWLAQG